MRTHLGCNPGAFRGDAKRFLKKKRHRLSGTCELKRVHVRLVARGMDLGRQLVQGMREVARKAGHARMCLDVLPEFVAAQRLYESLGFMPAELVSLGPVSGIAFTALAL